MGNYITDRVIRLMEHKKINQEGANILIMGFSFKENCPDIRNTRIIDVYQNLIKVGCNVVIYDPCVNTNEVKREYGIDLIKEPQEGKYDAILIAVAHDKFKKYSPQDLRRFTKKSHVLFDVKYLFKKENVDSRL